LFPLSTSFPPPPFFLGHNSALFYDRRILVYRPPPLLEVKSSPPPPSQHTGRKILTMGRLVPFFFPHAAPRTPFFFFFFSFAKRFPPRVEKEKIGRHKTPPVAYDFPPPSPPSQINEKGPPLPLSRNLNIHKWEGFPPGDPPQCGLPQPAQLPFPPLSKVFQEDDRPSLSPPPPSTSGRQCLIPPWVYNSFSLPGKTCSPPPPQGRLFSHSTTSNKFPKFPSGKQFPLLFNPSKSLQKKIKRTPSNETLLKEPHE